MAGLPSRPAAPLPPLPPGWTEHKAPSGIPYYYNKETKKSTYTRPVAEIQPVPTPPPAFPPPPPSSLGADSHSASYSAPPTHNVVDRKKEMEDLIFGNSQKQLQHQGGRGGHRGGFRGTHNFSERRRQPEDRPKHRYDIPNCAPWVLVKTKLGRRFVWNKDTNRSFWKFPPDVMKAVIEFDRMEREKRERSGRGGPSDTGDDAAMAEVEAELAAVEAKLEQEVVEVDGDEDMEYEEEYEEVEVTDDEGEEPENPSKRQRTEEPPEDRPMEMGEDDMAWQLAEMEAMEAQHDEEEDEEGLALTEEDCRALFKELLDDTRISPYTPWDKVLEDGTLYEDERYKALPNMKTRKECFDDWSRERIQFLKEQKAKQQKLDPRVPYLAFLHKHATPKLYWPEFRRKYKKEPEMKDTKLADKDKEKLYRDHIKRLGMRSTDLKSDLSALLKAQPLASLNRLSTLDTLPTALLTDLRFISLPLPTRDSLVETYISTLPPAPEGAGMSAEEEAEIAKKSEERRRREKALADRERRVREEQRRQERELAYGKGRLRDEEMEIKRAMKVGKEGLRGHLE